MKHDYDGSLQAVVWNSALQKKEEALECMKSRLMERSFVS